MMADGVLYSESLRIDSPEGEAELKLLQGTKVEDVRQSPFMAALGEGREIEWRCVNVEDAAWTYVGKWLGLPVSTVKIEKYGHSLVLSVLGEGTVPE